MKYKTTIQIISEAGDKHEAAEIAGEYLGGNLASDVDMKCSTRPYPDYSKGLTVGAIMSIFFAMLLVSSFQVKSSFSSSSGISGADAIQPPLKTTVVCKESQGFKKEWQAKQDKEILEYIKK